MPNQFLITPYVLHHHTPSLSKIAGSGWQKNEPTLVGGNAQSDHMAVIHRQIATFVAENAERGDRPVSISGDCCSTIGVLAGLQRAGIDPVIVWLDAHGDFNTHATTITGFVGGMPLAMITGRGDQTFVRGVSCRPVPDERVFLADARDLDPAERVLLQSSAVRHITDLSALTESLPADQPLYVHLDADFLNPIDAPSMKYPAAGGPTLNDALTLAQSLARTNRIVAVSLTAWQLDGDADKKTAQACLRVLDALLSGAAPAISSATRASTSARAGMHGR
jgi:arginase